MIREIHFAQVLSNDDPDNAGGLKVQIDAVEDGKAYGGGEFIPPCFPFAGSKVGFFFLPEKGTQVEVELESDPEKGTEDLSARWRSVLYNSKDKIPSEFLTDQTNRGGIKYGEGLILFDQKKDLVTLISNNVRLGEETASHPLVRGDTYNSQLTTFLTALETYLTAEDVYAGLEANHWIAAQAANLVWKNLSPPTTPVLNGVLTAYGTPLEATTNALKTGVITWRAAIAAMKAATGAFKTAKTTWLSTKCKTE
jgi:hypothetical protein